VKLLLDQNLSRRLVRLLAEQYPDTAHVLLLGMAENEDTDIWNYAIKNGYMIVSKDKDFYQRSARHGHPPKVIHLTMGNCSVQEISDILIKNAGHIKEFSKNQSKSYLLLP